MIYISTVRTKPLIVNYLNLQKCLAMVIEPSNNRLLFTKHGLHLYEIGKELLLNQLVLHIFTVLEEDSVNPITLRCYDKNLQVNSSSIDRPSHDLSLITASC
jgi:hypothetical protein